MVSAATKQPVRPVSGVCGQQRWQRLQLFGQSPAGYSGEYSQSGSLGWNSSRANITAGMSHARDYRQYSAGMSGGVTLYRGGSLCRRHWVTPWRLLKPWRGKYQGFRYQ
ncbi:hypothetical protein DMB90_13140 [Raoultella planticola]|uniref:Outer membrane usher protein fimD n=1 Tax=Raoultella planticola TaxID=575 RepID=A0A5P6A9Y6_RAOPL|nr:hypothetical protein DMB90_13140 [Raoultella planticola]